MSRSFRFDPPEPRPDSLSRPRLLRSLAGRWQHRVTSVVGGPGLGKTTLLAQAIAENRMAPRGEDIWIGVEEHDADADRLARVVAAAVTGHGNDDPRQAGLDDRAWDPAAVGDAVWHRSPIEACIVLDDVHLLPAGSTGAAWLAELITALPANGHLVLASRSEPPVPLARMASQGGALRVGEQELRFSDEELSGFATRRGLDPQRLGDTGGWPAMAELAASVGQGSTGTYLWEEVLEPLGTARRHVLAVLCDLGGSDEELISAAIGTSVDLKRALDGVPLVAQGADGWHVAHGLWRTAPGIALTPSERAEIRRRAIRHLTRHGRFDEAFSLLQEAELWDVAPTVLRSACLAVNQLVPTQLGRWLAASTETVRASVAGQLATGIHITYSDPSRAITPLRDAAAHARAEDDIDAELVGVAQIGLLGWHQQDLLVLGEQAARVIELEPTGHPVARALAAIARALLADLAADSATVVAELGSIESSVLDTAWEIHAGWLCGVVHLDLGDTDAALEIVDRLSRTADSATRHMVDALRLRAWWRQGRVDDVLAELPEVIAVEQRGGPTYALHTGQVLAGVTFAHVGDAVVGRRYLEDAVATAPPAPEGQPSVLMASVLAAVQLAEGNEPQAAATLHDAVMTHGLDQGQDRRAWRQVLAASYVLVPEARKHWDNAPLRGFLQRARDLAAIVVALRAGGDVHRLRMLDLTDLGAVRAALPSRFAAELAVGLAAVGRSEGRALLEMLGLAGRQVVREMGSGPGLSGLTRPARSLLAAVPAPPLSTTYLAVLGLLELRRDGPAGEEVVDPDLRRMRLHELVGFLVGHRRTTRTAITAALWPDLDERAAANNLGVTLNHLLRVLEPWRDSGEPSYLLRLDGPTVRLVTGPHLRLDVDDFDQHLLAAARADADGTPSLALEHDLAATALYRDHLHADLPDAEWFALDREHYRTRFVGAAVRAGQLLLGRADLEQAQVVANRALRVDPWSEGAYAVLVGAALARRDRSAALRMLTRCLDALADLGVDPSSTTQQLRRRVQTVEAA